MSLDHDAIFKQLLTEFFLEFLDLFAPDVLALLDPQSLVFLEKETFSDLLDPDRREADLVVQARVRDTLTTFLIHLEHQAQFDATLKDRMFRYFVRFLERYHVPICPIALCSYARPHRIEDGNYIIGLPNRPVLDFRYQVVQLNRLHWRDYINHPNPLATALMTRMQVAPQERRQVKLAGLQTLLGKPLNPRRRRLLERALETYLPLTDSDRHYVETAIAALQPKVEEPMDIFEITTRSDVYAQHRMLVRQLAHKFGPLPEEAVQRIGQILTPEQTLELADAVLSFTTLVELNAWLDANPPIPPDESYLWDGTYDDDEDIPPPTSAQ